MIKFYKIRKESVNGCNFESAVFGADCFIEQLPDIIDKGIPLFKIGVRYYVINLETRQILSDSMFFSEEELQYLEEVDKIDLIIKEKVDKF